jgi:hypothetical protein
VNSQHSSSDFVYSAKLGRDCTHPETVTKAYDNMILGLSAVPSRDHNQYAIPSPKMLPITEGIYFLVILVVRVRKYMGRHPEDAQMPKTNLNMANFP